MAKAAYIHIPFCAHKCDFCDFAAFAGVDYASHKYCQIVALEIKERISLNPNQDPLETIFYGGGTPGHIDPDDLRIIHSALKENIGIACECEITLETTPLAITSAKVFAWQEIGINRLSIGIESLQDKELEAIGRAHTAQESILGILKARSAGFKNIACDLMYGLPHQTVASWRQTISQTLALSPQHLSAYGLSIAQNSPLTIRYPQDSNTYPSEKTFEQMYMSLVDQCERNGLNQYEIANFAKPGFYSKHNMIYWKNEEYLAFGVSAHRYINSKRSANYRSLSRYMKNHIEEETSEYITPKMQLQEAIMLGFRLREGLNLESFTKRYGVNLYSKVGSMVQEFIEQDLMEQVNGYLKLSQKGVLVSNTILAKLIEKV